MSENLTRGGLPGEHGAMVPRQLVLPQDSMTPEERREHARRAALGRWRRYEDRYYKRLRQIGETALKAHTDLAHELRQLESVRRPELEHGLHRLIMAFTNLWEHAGAHLPKWDQDTLAALVEELREKTRRSQKGARTGSAS